MKKILEYIMWVLIIIIVVSQGALFQSLERGDRIILLAVDAIIYIIITVYYLQKD